MQFFVVAVVVVDFIVTTESMRWPHRVINYDQKFVADI